MKKFWIISTFILSTIFIYLYSTNKNGSSDFSIKQKEYIDFINNHPFATRNISAEDYDKIPKYDRPDLAMEQDFLMTIDFIIITYV